MPSNRFGGWGTACHYCDTTSTSASSGLDWSIQYQPEVTTTAGTTTTATATGTLCIASGASSGSRVVWEDHPVIYARGPHRWAGYRHDNGEANNPPTREDLNRGRRRAKEREKIDKRANKLLKQWLSEMEYNYLMEQGQLELPSQYEKNVIYIVKKDPHRKVIIAQQQKVSCLHKPMVIHTGEACIHIDSAYPDGDRLLANIALLKADEKKFLDTANISPLVGYQRPPLVGARIGISIRDFAGLLIREVRDTNFWFVQFDMDNAERPDSVNHCHETARDLQFPQQALQVPCDKYGGVYNHVMLPSVGQYFINADDMQEAVQIARHWRRLHAVELDCHVQDAAQAAEEEYAGGVTIHWDNNNDGNRMPPLLTYATTTTTETAGSWVIRNQQGDMEYVHG